MDEEIESEKQPQELGHPWRGEKKSYQVRTRVRKKERGVGKKHHPTVHPPPISYHIHAMTGFNKGERTDTTNTDKIISGVVSVVSIVFE